MAFFASLVSLVGAEGFLRWRDLADPPAFEANAQYGYLMRPNQSASTRGHRFRINHAGLRGADFTLPKPNGVFRIVFLGDSITFGGGRIPDQDLFVNRAALILASSNHRQIEAINLSAPGWGIQNMAGYVATNGLLDADALVWVISSSDFRRPKSTLEENGFLEHKPWSRLIYATTHVFRFARRSVDNGVPQRTDSDPLRQNAHTLRRTLSQISNNNVACVVIAVPAAYENAQSLADLNTFRSATASVSVPFTEVRPALQQHRPEEMFLDGVHLSVDGHKVVSEAIVAFLQQTVFHQTQNSIAPEIRNARGKI